MHTIHVSLRQRNFRLGGKLKSFSASGARLWNCLPSDWYKLMKSVFKGKLHKLLFTVLGIEDDYVDACSLISILNTFVFRDVTAYNDIFLAYNCIVKSCIILFY